jgi:predicted nucleic acid binding AN1-type Zn finger protein
MCKCGEVFCCKHKSPEDHSCTYDYQKLGREKLAQSMPVVRVVKVAPV